MNDFRSAIYSYVATGLEGAFPKITLSSTDFTSKPKLPACQLTQIDSYADDTSSESGNREVRTVCVFEGQVFSAKSFVEAFSIIRKVDELLAACGLRRTMLQPIDDADATIKRIVARWRGAVDSKGRMSK